MSSKNLEHNITTLKKIGAKGTKFALAVKGNAYGHGLSEILQMAEPLADYFLVNSIEELQVVRKHSKKPTFILGYIVTSALIDAIKLGCIMGIFSYDQLRCVDAAAKSIKKVQEVHIACDALLGREGFLECDLAGAFKKAKTLSNIRITGMYGHFANIEDTNNFTHAEKQINAYERMRQIAVSAGHETIDTHLSATSGLLAYEKSTGKNTIVRIGIGMYGLWPSADLEYFHQKHMTLRAVLSWKTHIAQIKKLASGTTIGYGLTYMTKKPMTVALIPQGYADGYARSLSSKGEVLIRGERCTVLGRVSMNMFVVDVTHIRAAKEGDTVVLIGGQEKKRISAEELAEKSGTINYEATTRISPLLPRIIS